MTVLKVKKIANPRRKKRNAKRRHRKMSAKQIRIFGTKRQKAALKRRTKRKSNPVRVVVRNRKRKARKVRRHRRSNPALVLTLGSVNPRRKRRNKPVAAKAKKNRRRRVNSHRRRRSRRNPVVKVVTRRRSNKSHRRRRSRRNPTRVVVVSPRRNRRHGHRRRNPPSLFGHPMFGKDALELIGGGLIGVTASKFIPTLLPSSITGGIGGSNIGRTIMTGAAAVVAGWAGSKVSPVFGQGVLFGGMMQTLSVALNAFLPSIYTALNPSLGDLVPGQFTVPQNPIRAALPMPAAPVAGAQVRITQSGLGRAFRPAF